MTPKLLLTALLLSPGLAGAAEVSPEMKNFCQYGKEIEYAGDGGASWRSACEANPPDESKLNDSFRWFPQLSTRWSESGSRRQQVEELYKLFTEDPQLKNIKDDSKRQDAQLVQRCLTKKTCQDTYKKPEEFEEISPAINGKTFPIWLEQEQAAKMLPYLLISENETMRIAKFKEMNIPLDEKERKKFCETAKEACATFDKKQAQLVTNKAVVTALKEQKGIEDAEKFQMFVENGRKASMTDGAGAGGVLAQFSAAYTDDASKPFKLQAKQRPETAAPPPAPGGSSISVGPVTVDTQSAKKAWTAVAGGVASGLAVAGGMLAWRSGRKEGEKQVVAEDKDAIATKEFVMQKETAIDPARISGDELAAYQKAHALYEKSEYKGISGSFEAWYVGQGQAEMKQNGLMSADAGYKALLQHVNRINGPLVQ
jgi:hypothetical protein